MDFRPCSAARRALALWLALAPSPALAGAWTLPQGSGQLIQTFSGWSGRSAAGTRETALSAQTYLEYGFAERLTAFGEVSPARLQSSAPRKSVHFGFDYAGAGLRGRLWSDDAWTFSLEAGAYVPGALDARALVGRNLTVFGAPAFAEAQAGYRWLSAGPGEWRADFTLGVALTPKAQLLAQAFSIVSQGRAGGCPQWRSHKGEFSLVFALDEKWSLQLGGFATLFRRGTNSEYGALVALWRRF